jgi:hypothetical protein
MTSSGTLLPNQCVKVTPQAGPDRWDARLDGVSPSNVGALQNGSGVFQAVFQPFKTARACSRPCSSPSGVFQA